MNRSIKLAAAATLSLGISSAFAADWAITEAYIGGLPGPDGTADWIEVTYIGAGSGDTGNLYYDDESADAAAAGKLDSFTLNYGQSAVFLISDNATAELARPELGTVVNEFNFLWTYAGAEINVGITNGGGALGGGGDTAFIGEMTDLGGGAMLFSPVAQLTYLATDIINDGLSTIEQTLGGVLTGSVVGVNDAFASMPIYNTGLGTAEFPFVQMVGSPGIAAVPVPAALPLLGAGLAALGFRARRRA